METHRNTLRMLLKERAYKHGQFKLSSGKESEHYVNCKPVTLSCEGNALLSHLMIEHVEDDAVAVGGLTLGADPLVCGIAQKAYYSGKHIDALIVRRNPKATQEKRELKQDGMAQLLICQRQPTANSQQPTANKPPDNFLKNFGKLLDIKKAKRSHTNRFVK